MAKARQSRIQDDGVSRSQNEWRVWKTVHSYLLGLDLNRTEVGLMRD